MEYFRFILFFPSPQIRSVKKGEINSPGGKESQKDPTECIR